MIKIWNNNNIPGFDKNIDQQEPNLKSFILDNGKVNSAVIVCPGGAYNHLAEHEGEPIAKWINSIGMTAFVLNYRIAPYKYPCSLLDLKRAIRYVRYNHKKFNIDPDKICVLGFSAGGHLVASSAVYFDLGLKDDALDEIDKVSSRPDMTVLCYSVINMGEYTHEGSRISLLGENPSKEMIDYLSIEKHVNENTPESFIWATAPDNSVPMENSLLYAKALKEKGIPFELHIFPEGGHGLGLRDDFPYVTRWANMCEDWFRERKFI